MNNNNVLLFLFYTCILLKTMGVNENQVFNTHNEDFELNTQTFFVVVECVLLSIRDAHTYIFIAL